MQTLSEIRAILQAADLHPRRRLGQNFLIDKNLMLKLLELAGLSGGETVLEVGAGTGSLTEELLDRARRVVAVEIDRGLCQELRRRLAGRENLLLIEGDVLASKHAISPEVLGRLGGQAVVVANLPYSIATPLVAEALVGSWRAICGPAPSCRFESLTFTVQKEVVDRMTACAGGGAYGPVSVLVGLLGRAALGPSVPASAFWPAPKVASRILRIDLDAEKAQRVSSIDALTAVLNLAFTQRRKQIGSIARSDRVRIAFPAGGSMGQALAATGIKETSRPEDISPQQYAALANAMTRCR